MVSTATAINTGPAVGSNGAATSYNTGGERITGELIGFRVVYGDSPPAGTTDVTIEAVGGPLGTRTLLTISNAATDGVFLVRSATVDAAGAAITGEYTDAPMIQDRIKATIAGANADDYAIVTPILEADV